MEPTLGNLFGVLKKSPSPRRTVADVCSSITNELQEIQQAQEEEAERIRKELLVLNVELQQSTAEAGRAQKAIQNIKQLFGD